MTEREIALLTIRTMSRLAGACRDMFRTENTQKRISASEQEWYERLMAFEQSNTPVSDSARLAWLELDEDSRDLLSKRGVDADILLLQLDLYPNTVVSTLLGQPNPKKSPQLAKTP